MNVTAEPEIRKMSNKKPGPFGPDFACILPINKPIGKTSFSLVSRLRKHLGIQKIGHSGTLDPFASGVMVMLIGRKYTRLSDTFLNADKEYIAGLKLGITTDSFDCDGAVTGESETVPSDAMVTEALAQFQGTILQTPPMFSAKKQNGKKLYELARQGIVVDRPAVSVTLSTDQIQYTYPELDLRVACSKGTYIRSIADDLGKILTCGAHLIRLQRTRSGNFSLDRCFDGNLLYQEEIDSSLLKEYCIFPE